MVKILSNPPLKCDVCGEKFERIIIDGRTKAGPWGYMCPTCWKVEGCGKFGPGNGQKYEKQGDNFTKTA